MKLTKPGNKKPGKTEKKNRRKTEEKTGVETFAEEKCLDKSR